MGSEFTNKGEIAFSIAVDIPNSDGSEGPAPCSGCRGSSQIVQESLAEDGSGHSQAQHGDSTRIDNHGEILKQEGIGSPQLGSTWDQPNANL